LSENGVKSENSAATRPKFDRRLFGMLASRNRLEYRYSTSAR